MGYILGKANSILETNGKMERFAELDLYYNQVDNPNADRPASILNNRNVLNIQNLPKS